MTLTRTWFGTTLIVIGAAFFTGCDTGTPSAKPVAAEKKPATTNTAEKPEASQSSSPASATVPASDKIAPPSEPAKSESSAVPAALPAADQLSVEWIHDANVPAPGNPTTSHDAITKSTSKGRLVLKQGSGELPASGWAIYFSIGDFVDLDKEDFAKNNPTLKLTYCIAGRYKIEPQEGFQPLHAGESLEIPYVGNRVVMVTSDRPAGFFLVSVDNDGKEEVVGDIAINYGPIAPFQPLPDPVGAQMTAAARYANYSKYPGSAPPQLVLPLPKKVHINSSKSLELKKLSAEVKFPPGLEFEGTIAKVIAGVRAENPTTNVALAIDPKLAREEYRLVVDENGISITGGTPAGVFYGVMTLAELIERQPESGRLSYLTIEDKPELGHRGLMVDVCRHFYDLETLKQTVGTMARYKLNVLQLRAGNQEPARADENRRSPRPRRPGSRRKSAEAPRDL
jgi:hypothetical protein